MKLSSMNENDQEKGFSNLKWLPIFGRWDLKQKNILVFEGGELNPPDFSDVSLSQRRETKIQQTESSPALGQVIFDQRFIDGSMSVSILFEDIDYRSQAHIMIQCDPTSGEMLTFGIGGGGTPYDKGTGPLYGLRGFGELQDSNARRQGEIEQPSKGWIYLYTGGEGKNLKPKKWYDLEIVTQGSLVIMRVDGVEIGRHNLPASSLSGKQIGLFCGNYTNVQFKNLKVSARKSRAFVVMQFNTPEYDALFNDVIKPICAEFLMIAQRADSTYLPGIVISDIKQQIMESRVVIAEITPANPNVYYEVGYADALNKPLILISDKSEGIKPFDLRAYRTIFYENSIAGKNKVEEDLRNYLSAILSQ